MKAFFRCSLLIALAATAAVRASAAEQPDSPVSGKHGYTVMVELKVNEEGKTESVRLLETNDKSVGDILNKMALAMALKVEMGPRQKDGKPIRYTARAPFFFAIEGDEGPEAEQLPKPKVKDATMPAYPPALRESGQVGGAVLELFIDAQGNLTELKTMRASHPEFESAARDSVSKWKFVGAQKDGQPVASRTRLAIAFETEADMADLRWRIAPRPSLGSFVVIRPDEPIPDPDAAPAEAPKEDEAPKEPAPTK